MFVTSLICDNDDEYTKFAKPIIHLHHIPQLWDMEQVNCGISETGLLKLKDDLSRYKLANSTVGYGPGALWDKWDWSLEAKG